MPTEIHEAFVRYLFLALYSFVERRKLGEVYSNGIRLRVRRGKIRLPDVIFLRKDHYHARHNRAWDGADLVMEVVSGSANDHNHDYDMKLLDYAEAKVPEYWIVDPEPRVVIIYKLNGDRYETHGQFSPGERATSSILPDFSVDVASLFAVMDEIPE